MSRILVIFLLKPKYSFNIVNLKPGINQQLGLRNAQLDLVPEAAKAAEVSSPVWRTLARLFRGHVR